MPETRKQPKTAGSEFISRAELARRRGVARSTVSRACTGPLADAVAGDLIDASHPAVVAWLAKSEPSERRQGAVDGGSTPTTKAELTQLLVRKRRAEAQKLELANAEKSGQLIEREFVSTYLFGALEEMSQRLLRDLPRRCSAQIWESFGTDGTREQAERMLRDEIGSELTRAKSKITRALRARAKKLQEEPSK